MSKTTKFTLPQEIVDGVIYALNASSNAVAAAKKAAEAAKEFGFLTGDAAAANGVAAETAEAKSLAYEERDRAVTYAFCMEADKVDDIARASRHTADVHRLNARLKSRVEIDRAAKGLAAIATAKAAKAAEAVIETAHAAVEAAEAARLLTRRLLPNLPLC